MKGFRFKQFVKSLQKSLYSFARTKWGAVVLVIAAFITLNSVLHLIESILGIAILNNTTLFDSTCFSACQSTDNINEKSYGHLLCYEPYDVVYTWVNGSDIKHKKDLEYYANLNKKEMQSDKLIVSNDLNSTNETMEKDTESDTASSNRYRDNDELRYSLRSLKKFAGWIRKVYIVTNGQVPAWLNINHPKIEIVKHSDIFLNKSHLPVFSSPAIEANIHRIKGLSDKFIYLNDDVFFGNHILPEDFYTKSKGQKVFLSWEVPNCNEGCSDAWIGDGTCDIACNVTACDFDGGDCIGPNVQIRPSWDTNYQTDWSQSFKKELEQKAMYCDPRCRDHWVGDKFCDNACNVKECGFDAGDCGIENFNQLFSAYVTEETDKIIVPFNTSAMFLNLTKLFPIGKSEITSGLHDNPSVVRTSTVSQAYKLITLTFFKNLSDVAANFFIEGTRENEKITKNFTIHIASRTVPNNINESPRIIVDEGDKIKDETEDPLLQVIGESENNKEIVNTQQLSEYKSKSIDQNTEDQVKEFSDKNNDPRSQPEPNLNTQTTHYTGRKIQHINKSFDQSNPTNRTISRFVGRRILSAAPMININIVSHKNIQYSLKDELVANEMDFVEQSMMEKVAKKIIKKEIEENQINKEERIAPARRKLLLDKFGESLIHVNKLLNKEYGRVTRKVPAHMPHLIDKHIMEEVYKKWEKEFNITSSNRFRSSNDMQYTFTYFYYLMHQGTKYDTYKFFSEKLDRNNDGVLDDYEIRLLAFILFKAGVKKEKLSELKMDYIRNHNLSIEIGNESLSNGSLGDVLTTSNNDWSTTFTWSFQEDEGMSEEFAELVNELLYLAISYSNTTKPNIVSFIESGLDDLVRSKKPYMKKFKYQLVGLKQVAFHMIRDDVKQVKKELDDIRYRQPKFICLNDDMNKTAPNPEVVKALHNFYQWYFPERSDFELPEGQENPFLYIDELREFYQKKKREKILIYASLFLLIIGLISIIVIFRKPKKDVTEILDQRQYEDEETGFRKFSPSQTTRKRKTVGLEIKIV